MHIHYIMMWDCPSMRVSDYSTRSDRVGKACSKFILYNFATYWNLGSMPSLRLLMPYGKPSPQ